MLGTTLAESAGDLVPIVIPVGALIFAAFCVGVAAVKSVAINRSRERTKREIAAYMAEGSISAEDAERILNHREPARCGL